MDYPVILLQCSAYSVTFTFQSICISVIDDVLSIAPNTAATFVELVITAATVDQNCYGS